MAKQLQYVNPKELVIVGLDDEREDHPLWDPRSFKEVDEDLVKNIMTYGVFQPVQVRLEDGKMLVVDGRQRVKASREAAERQASAGEVTVMVPVVEQGGDDVRVTGIMISANEQRTADEVLEKANKAQRMLDLQGDLDAVCIAFGKTRTTINNWLLLNKADPRVHAAIREKKISSSAGIDIAKLPRDQQAARLEELLKAYNGQGKVPVSATRQMLEQEGYLSDSSKANASSPNDGFEPRGGGGGGGGGGSPVIGEGRPETETEKKKRTSPTDRPSHQAGIKRSWLRKALKSEAAEKLDNDQLAVLKWFAYGEAEKGSWFDEFQFEAEAEMRSSAT